MLAHEAVRVLTECRNRAVGSDREVVSLSTIEQILNSHLDHHPQSDKLSEGIAQMGSGDDAFDEDDAAND